MAIDEMLTIGSFICNPPVEAAFDGRVAGK